MNYINHAHFTLSLALSLYLSLSLAPLCSFLLSSPSLAALIRQRFVAHRGRLRFCRRCFSYLFLYLHLHLHSYSHIHLFAYSFSALLRCSSFTVFCAFRVVIAAPRPLHCCWAIARCLYLLLLLLLLLSLFVVCTLILQGALYFCDRCVWAMRFPTLVSIPAAAAPSPSSSSVSCR